MWRSLQNHQKSEEQCDENKQVSGGQIQDHLALELSHDCPYSYHTLYVDTAEIKEHLFTDHTDTTYFYKVVFDVEEDVDEYSPETEPKSQTQYQGCPNQ